jgi:hypothetical protein
MSLHLLSDRECIRSCLLRAVAAKEISMTKPWPGQIFIRSVYIVKYKYQRARLYLLELQKDLQTEENIEFQRAAPGSGKQELAVKNIVNRLFFIDLSLLRKI